MRDVVLRYVKSVSSVHDRGRGGDDMQDWSLCVHNLLLLHYNLYRLPSPITCIFYCTGRLNGSVSK